MQALLTILGNLIDNAFDAVSQISGPKRVTVSVVETPTSLTVKVTDNGPGIAPGTGELIFADRYTTSPSSERGLGLTLVDRLVRRLRGTIAVGEGPGASFEVRLPTGTTIPGSLR